MITITKQVHFTRGGAGRRKMSTTPPKPKVERKPRIPHIAKLMALAIRYDKLLRDGTVADTVELAELCHVSQPRITQILNLNHLAPDIQEDLLHLPAVATGRDPIHEQMLRPIKAEISWEKQREMWSNIEPQLAAS
jgi:hypothetical protein